MSDVQSLRVGDRVLAEDASGVEHAGVITYGPARDRFGIRGAFVKYWVELDGKEGEIPWPIEYVRAEPPASSPASGGEA